MFGAHLAFGAVEGFAAHWAHAFLDQLAVPDGDAKVGRALDGQTRVSCPKCRVPMVRMLDHEQRHVWIERCATCGGTWLDAGEFRDLSHFWIGDVIKGWFARARR